MVFLFLSIISITVTFDVPGDKKDMQVKDRKGKVDKYTI